MNCLEAGGDPQEWSVDCKHLGLGPIDLIYKPCVCECYVCASSFLSVLKLCSHCPKKKPIVFLLSVSTIRN